MEKLYFQNPKLTVALEIGQVKESQAVDQEVLKSIVFRKIQWGLLGKRKFPPTGD